MAEAAITFSRYRRRRNKMVQLSTASRLLIKSIRHPDRAIKRSLELIKFSRLDPSTEQQRILTLLNSVFGIDAEDVQRELLESSFTDWSRARRVELENFPRPYRFGSTPERDCESLYYVVRAARPDIVVETGVCYGASSAYILQALAANGRGSLYSIDLGNRPDEPPSDFFVPTALRNRWRLIIGDCKQVLPPLLRRLGKIDLFHHDSLHTYDHMMWEYETAFPRLAPQGILTSHDVNVVLSLARPFRRNPFAVFCERHNLRMQIALNFGLAVSSSAHYAKPLKLSHGGPIDGFARERKRA
jgi:predicted O-methyltransferase YrrM